MKANKYILLCKRSIYTPKGWRAVRNCDGAEVYTWNTEDEAQQYREENGLKDAIVAPLFFLSPKHIRVQP